MAERRNPTQAELRQLLDYDPKTGVLTWRERTGPYSRRWNVKYAGKPAGTSRELGYIQIKVLNRNYLAHRIIWAMEFDAWPECIDHRNGNPGDNRLRNLRAVSRGINQRNQRMHSTNTSGRTGVYWNRFTQKWVAQIKMQNISIYLGSYENFDDAATARKRAERKNGFTGRA